MQVPLA